MSSTDLAALAQFEHKAVRDLAWVMLSPPLLSESSSVNQGTKVTRQWCQQQCDRQLTWLQLLDADPRPLLEVVQSITRPTLGHYFETLVIYWLQHLPDIELVVSNLVVNQNGQQLGEFDVIFREHQQAIFHHWELAVKFYLCFGEQPFQWLGPNPADRMTTKLDKVFSRQLRLAEKPAAHALLLHDYGVNELASAAFIKGYLFYPLNSNWRQPAIMPPGIATDHLSGWWAYPVDLIDWIIEQPTSDRWTVLSRLDWLAPWVVSSAEGLMKGSVLCDYIQSQFAQPAQALLISQMQRQGANWVEISRGFVVDSAWPDRAKCL